LMIQKKKLREEKKLFKKKTNIKIPKSALSVDFINHIQIPSTNHVNPNQILCMQTHHITTHNHP
jgi:hypothetical protein